MLLVTLGDTREIGASCHYLNLGGTGILLDAGVHPEKDGPEGVPRIELVRDHPDWAVDHVVVSHAHHDHLGGLPVIIQQFPHVLIHMSRATRQLADLLLPASARLQKRKLAEGSVTHPPLFTEEEVAVHDYLYHTHELGEDFDLTGMHAEGPVTGRLYNAGHVLGAVGVLIEAEEEGRRRRFFYTSDTSLRPQAIIPGGEYPEGPIDVLLMEGTLGADPTAESTTRKLEEERLEQAIVRTITRGGTVLIPVFALGRAQEIIALIGRFKERGRIPEDLPIYTTGSMRAVSDLYDRTRFTSPRVDPEFEVFGVQQKRLPRSQAGTLAALQEPSIHIAGSGMMFEGTLSNRLAQAIVGDAKNSICIVGFAKEDSPADRLLRAAPRGSGTEVVLDRARGPQAVHCEVERFRFSGHSHRRDLLQLVERMQPRKVIVVHAETEARDWLTDNIQFFYPDIEMLVPEQGVPIEL